LVAFPSTSTSGSSASGRILWGSTAPASTTWTQVPDEPASDWANVPDEPAAEWTQLRA
jgi:hypothetical protein